MSEPIFYLKYSFSRIAESDAMCPLMWPHDPLMWSQFTEFVSNIHKKIDVRLKALPCGMFLVCEI